MKNQVNRPLVSDNKIQCCVKCFNSQANDSRTARVDLIIFVAQMEKIVITSL